MQLQFIPFKIGFLWSNTAIPALLPLFIAVEKVFTWDVFQSPRRSCLDVFNCPKMCPLRWVLNMGNKKKSHGAKSGLYGGWGCIVILCWAKNSLTATDVWLGALSWWRNQVCAIFLMRRSSVMIRWTPFSVVLPPLPLSAHRNVGPYPERPSHEPYCSQFLKLKDALRAVCPQRTHFRPWGPCATWGLGLKIKQHSHKLSSTTAKFRNQIFRVSRRAWSRNAAPDSSEFSPVTRHKNYYALC